MALSNGTMARLVKEFNISADDFKCHEAESEGSDAVIIDMVAGILVFSCLFIVGGMVHGILLGETRCRMLYQGIALRVMFRVSLPKSVLISPSSGHKITKNMQRGW